MGRAYTATDTATHTRARAHTHSERPGDWSNGALAFVDSFSTDPCRVGAFHSNLTVATTATWMVSVDGDWVADPLTTISCEVDRGGVEACEEEGPLDDSSGEVAGLPAQARRTVPCARLSAGGATTPVWMPILGLGTAYISAPHGTGAQDLRAVEQPPAIREAIARDYTLLDLGSELHQAYANERLTGELLEAHGRRLGRRQRQRVFLTTKLSPNEHGYAATLRAVQRSLRYLRTDVIDLYLIHHPQCLMVDQCEGTWVDSWRAMERLHGAGVLRAIGASNFDGVCQHYPVNTAHVTRTT